MPSGIRPRPRCPAGARLFLPTILIIMLGCTPGDPGVAQTWDDLTRVGGEERFEPSMVDGLPEPARRYLLRAIDPGAPLAASVELRMHGDIRLDPERDPIAMGAEQILAPEAGFIWRARTWGGLMRIRGFDLYAGGAGRMEWRLFGLLPVVQAEGPDVTRSAAGRLAMEWTLIPTALLPGRGAAWEEVDGASARYRVRVDGEEVTVTVEVDPHGRLTRVSAPRWREEPGPAYELFVVELSGEIGDGGIRIPGRMEAGWRLGEPDEFRFFRATLDRVLYR
jgi:hypothetical protein